MADSTEHFVSLGRIVGLFGVKGWVKVYSYTEPREGILNYGHWFVGRTNDWTRVELADGKRSGKSVIAQLKGVDERDAAGRLLGLDVAIERSALPDTEDGSFYWTDLEGLEVVRRDGQSLGAVRRLLETGAHDVLVVGEEAERLIPFVWNETVLEVDFESGVIRVDWEWD